MISDYEHVQQLKNRKIAKEENRLGDIRRDKLQYQGPFNGRTFNSNKINHANQRIKGNKFSTIK